MTTQWGGCPEKNPLPHSRFDPGFADSRPDFSGQPHRQTSLGDCPPAHAAQPLSAQHEKFGNLGKRPAGQDSSMVGVASLPPPPPPRPHHVNTGPRIHAIFPCPNMPGMVRDAEFHARHARKRLHIVRHLKFGSKSSRTEQSDSTDIRHGRPPCPPFGTSHFAGLSFRYGDCSLRTHNRHAVSVVSCDLEGPSCCHRDEWSLGRLHLLPFILFPILFPSSRSPFSCFIIPRPKHPPTSRD